ncbi:MAG TPA: hypothetical protein DCE33_16175 [Rhodospirillaceae bacterium]|nr:hypothetical protein [Rhodospirillaceae bacterium]
MAIQPHIVADISANGFGHLAQVSPILEELAAEQEIRLTLRTEVDLEICSQFLSVPFEIGPPPPDPNMRMKGPLDVDVEGLFADYRKLIGEWDQMISADADLLGTLKADLVISNIAVASLASASAAGIPVAGICSLNWADVFATYCGSDGEAGEVLERLTENYNKADRVIQLAPHMPMEWLKETRSVGPVARRGENRRDELEALRPANHYVLATMGGIPGMHTEVPLPMLDGVVWIVPPEWEGVREDWLSRARFDIPFIDLMRSSDALVTKAGYGSVTECAVNGTRILYTERTNWCETPMLEEWMAEPCTARRVEREVMQAGNFAAELEKILAIPVEPPIEPTGAAEAAAVLQELI